MAWRASSSRSMKEIHLLFQSSPACAATREFRKRNYGDIKARNPSLPLPRGIRQPLPLPLPSSSKGRLSCSSLEQQRPPRPASSSSQKQLADQEGSVLTSEKLKWLLKPGKELVKLGSQGSALFVEREEPIRPPMPLGLGTLAPQLLL